MVNELFKNKMFPRVVVSLIVLIGAIYVVLSNGYPDATTKWAFGAVGLILGHWLR